MNTTIIQSTLIFLAIFCHSIAVQAQTTMNDNGAKHYLYVPEDDDPNYVDYIIPQNPSFNSIKIELKGGDGGRAVAGSCSADGGEGATVEFTLFVGNNYNDGQLRPGTLLRAIVGDAGEWESTTSGSTHSVGAGGGGTALLAYIGNSWRIIAVAGGGGGAYIGNALGYCVATKHGQGGRSTRNGGNGNGSLSGGGGSNGHGGEGGGDIGDGDLSGGGGGAFSNGSGQSCREGEKGYPEGGVGGANCFFNFIDPTVGGWGFGGGGSGDEAGGGGGGYSGGGGGGLEGAGGGGGSYINEEYTFLPTITEGGSVSPIYGGYFSYEFEDTCTPELNGFEFVNPLCSSDGKTRIRILTNIETSNVCFGDLQFDLYPSNGWLYVGNGEFRFVRPGIYLINLYHAQSGWLYEYQFILVEESNAPPEALCQDVTVDINAVNYNGSNLPNLINNGSSSICDDPLTLSATPNTFTCDQLGANTVTLTVTGSNQVASTCSATVTVEYVPEDETIALCQPAKTFELSGEPIVLTVNDIDNGSSFDGCSTQISISPTAFDCDDVGSQTVTLSINSDGQITTCTTSVTITNSGTPIAECEAFSTIALNNGSISISYSNLDSQSESNNCTSLSYSLSSSVFDCSHLGTNEVVLTVTDGYGNSSSCSGMVNVVDMSTPVAVCQNITVELDENGDYTLDPADLNNGSSDPCALSFSASLTTFDCDDIGTNAIVLTASDAQGNESTCNASVTVEDKVAPEAFCLDLTLQLYGTTASFGDFFGQFLAASTDNCGVSSANFLSPTTLDCDDIGVNTVAFQVQDDAGNSNNCSFTITLQDGGEPNMFCQDITVQLDETGNVSVSPDQIDNGSFDNCSTFSKSLSTSSFDCTEVGQNEVILTATDSYGNSGTCTSIITVEDNIAPTITCVDPPYEYLFWLNDPGICTRTEEIPVPAMTDNCGSIPVLRYHFREVDEEGNHLPGKDWSDWSTEQIQTMDPAYWKFEWQAIDPSGNQSTCSFRARVWDLEDPVAVCYDPVITFAGEESITLSPSDLWNEAASSDNCGPVTLLGIEQLVFTCDQVGQTLSVEVNILDQQNFLGRCNANVEIKGLPCDWAIDPNGVGCTTASMYYEGNPERFELTSEACYDPHYYSPSDKNGFVQQELCGDGEIIAQITEVIGSGWAGITMREDNSPTAKMIDLMIDGFNLTRRKARMSTGSTAFAHQFQTQGKNWLRLARVGNQFSAFHSLDGMNWEVVFSTQIAMNDCIQVGLATQNTTPAGEMTGVFENVQINGGVGNVLAAPIEIGDIPASQPHSNFSLFPNPATDEVHLKFESIISNEIVVRIYNHMGQIVLQQNWEEVSHTTQTLNVSDLPSGTYVVEAISGNERISKKLVVSKR